MPASKAVSMGVVLSNGTDFISLFFRSEKNDLNNEVVDKFYWVQSNASGVPTSGRNNALNGYFSSQSAAEADTPDGYGEVPPSDEFQSRREWGYKPDFPFDSGFIVGGDNISLNRAFADITQFVNAGGTYVGLTLFWDDVFLSLDTQNANADSSWARYDAFVNFVKNLNSTTKLAIRIAVTKAGRTHNDMQGTYNPTNNLWPLSKAQKDNRGNVIRNIYDGGGFSYADSSAVSQAIDFITKVKNRYGGSAFMGPRLMWVSAATTTQEEAGYDYENQWDGSNYYPNPVKRVYDYSDAAISAFKTFLASPSKYNNDISNLNAAWGSNYSEFSQITPPLPPSEDTDDGISLVYSGIKGNDWWYFHYSLMKSFHISCQSAVGNTCKYVIEFGSCSDPLSVRRLSINVADFASFSDMIKAQFLTLPSNPSLGISLDVIRANYTKKIGNELNTGDYPQYTGEGSVFNFMKNAGISAIDSGALDMLFISNSAKWGTQFDETFNAFVFLKNYAQSSSVRVVASKTVNYSLTQLLNDSTFLARKFQEEGGHNTRLDMKISSSIITPPDPTIQKSIFTFNQKTNGNPIPTSGNYENGYLKFEALSHGIVSRVPDPVGTKRGMQCKLEYTIRNAANEVVINLKDNYGGFHPNYQPFAGDADTPPAESYYRVWAPSFYDYPNLDFVRNFYNNFTPISGTPFNVANDRGNNHFDQYSKYFPEGVYTIAIKNTGLFPFEFRAGKTSVFNTPNLADVYTTIPADNTERTFTLNVQNNGVGEAYKINAFID